MGAWSSIRAGVKKSSPLGSRERCFGLGRYVPPVSSLTLLQWEIHYSITFAWIALYGLSQYPNCPHSHVPLTEGGSSMGAPLRQGAGTVTGHEQTSSRRGEAGSCAPIPSTAY